MREQMLEKADKMDKILKQAAKVLAVNTNYATMVSAPNMNRNKLKFKRQKTRFLNANKNWTQNWSFLPKMLVATPW